MKKIRVALVGCGRISPKHLESYASLREAELKAVCDIVEEKARLAANKYHCRYYTRYDEMLKQEDVDLIDICTPHDLHAPMTIKAARHKKHVITEKPMGISNIEAEQMILACKENGVRLFVVKQNRFNVPVVKLKEAIDKNRFGKIFLASSKVLWARPQSYYDEDPWRGKSAYGDGVLMNQTSHHIDLLGWLAGPIKSVYCIKGTFTHKIESEDTAVALLKFKNGAMGTFEATTCTYPKNIEGSVTVLGEKGTVKIGGTSANIMERWEFKDPTHEDELIAKMGSNPPDVYGWGHRDFIKDVLDALTYDRPANVEGESGRETLNIIQAMVKSANENREIFL